MKTDILGIQFDNLTREEAKEAGAALLLSLIHICKWP